jgi:hypothetical protein
MTSYIEPYLDERLDLALEKARRLIQNKIESQDDLWMAFRIIISDHYGIPLFDKYFEDKSIDQLAFEAFFIKERAISAADTASKQISDNTDLAAQAIEDDFAAFEKVDLPQPSEEERQRMLEFMNTGKFPGES